MSSFNWSASEFLPGIPGINEYAYVTAVLKIQWNGSQWVFIDSCGAAINAPGEGAPGGDHAASHQIGGGDQLVLSSIGGDLPASRVTGLNSVATSGSATDLGTGTLALARIADNSLTYAKLPQIATDSLLGRDTAGTGNIETIGLGGGLEMDGGGALQLAQIGGGGQDLNIGPGGSSPSITDGRVTNAKLASMPGLTIKGNDSVGGATPQDLSVAEVVAMLGVGGGGGLTLTETEVNLGSTPKRSGKFNITGAGLTVGKHIVITQANGPYTGKGTRTDEAEMDQLSVSGKVTSTTNIECFWGSRTFVRGNFKFAYAVSA